MIDVKDPARGSLGRADTRCWSQVVDCVAQRVPVSVALGELTDFQPLRRTNGWSGVGYAKLGLAGCRDDTAWPQRWAAAINSLPAEVRSVAVVYADAAASASPSAEEVLHHADQLGCWGVLFDTHFKQDRNLIDWLSPDRLAKYIHSARRHGLAVALAGSLGSHNLEVAMELHPDLIAVRGAACRGGRNGQVDLEKVRRLAQFVSRTPNQATGYLFPSGERV